MLSPINSNVSYRGHRADGVNKTSLQGQFYKTRMCPYLVRPAGCKRKSHCCYAHDESELQKTVDLTKTKLCARFEEKGRCNNVPCQFAHGIEELRSTNHCFKTQQCRRFNQTRSCPSGDFCRHAHGHEEADLVAKLRLDGLLSPQIQVLHFGEFLESLGMALPESAKCRTQAPKADVFDRRHLPPQRNHPRRRSSLGYEDGDGMGPSLIPVMDDHSGSGEAPGSLQGDPLVPSGISPGALSSVTGKRQNALTGGLTRPRRTGVMNMQRKESLDRRLSPPTSPSIPSPMEIEDMFKRSESTGEGMDYSSSNSPSGFSHPNNYPSSRPRASINPHAPPMQSCSFNHFNDSVPVHFSSFEHPPIPHTMMRMGTGDMPTAQPSDFFHPSCSISMDFSAMDSIIPPQPASIESNSPPKLNATGSITFGYPNDRHSYLRSYSYQRPAYDYQRTISHDLSELPQHTSTPVQMFANSLSSLNLNHQVPNCLGSSHYATPSPPPPLQPIVMTRNQQHDASRCCSSVTDPSGASFCGSSVSADD